jgi:aspartate 1-decarboxylase
MRRIMMKSKIHRATVTDTFIDYEGSLTIDSDLLEEANILPNEQIHVWDVTNGNRIITYALKGEAGSGVIRVNGGGAHSIKKGDVIIIATFTEMKTKEAKKFVPTVVFVDAANQITDKPVVVPTVVEVAATATSPVTPPAAGAKKRTTRKSDAAS